MPLTLTAILLGKAQTGGPHLQVTLKIGQDVLHLRLLPEQADIFPDLVQQQGGGHPTHDPRRITYNPAPGYTVTIAPVEASMETEEVEPAQEPLDEAEESPESESTAEAEETR